MADPETPRRVPDIADVERQLAELWRSAASEGRAVVRACTMTLVVVCDDGPEARREACEIVGRVCETHPGRALVVSMAAAAGGAGLEAWVSAYCHKSERGEEICSEVVTLEVHGDEAATLVPETLLQLLVADLPVYVWWRRRLGGDEGWLAELRDMADLLIVDGTRFPAPAEELRRLDELGRGAQRGRAADLLWMRLEPWREAVASFFDAASLRPCLDAVERIELVAGGAASGELTVSAAYLAGWLASRLGWSAKGGTWRRRDGGTVKLQLRRDAGLAGGRLGSVRLVTGRGSSAVVFDATREESAGPVVRLTVETAGSCPLPLRIRLPERGEAALLCGVLQVGHSDPVYTAALAAAIQAA